jgi:hypothetical protein
LFLSEKTIAASEGAQGRSLRKASRKIRLPRLRTWALPCRLPTAYPTRGPPSRGFVPVSLKNNNRTSSPCTRRPVRKMRSNSHPFLIVKPLSGTYDPCAFYCVKPHVLWVKKNEPENRSFSCEAFDEADRYLFSRNTHLLYFHSRTWSPRHDNHTYRKCLNNLSHGSITYSRHGRQESGNNPNYHKGQRTGHGIIKCENSFRRRFEYE